MEKNTNIVSANLAKRSGAAILDFLIAILLWLTLLTFVISPIYDSLYNTTAIQQDYVAIQLESNLYIEDPETTVITYVSTENIPAAVYNYYAEFREGKIYLEETDPFVFSNEWYNEHILNIGSTDDSITIYFEYDVDELDNPDPSKVGVPLDTATTEELDAFYLAAYTAAQQDLARYAPYAELAAQISNYSLQILSISGLISIAVLYLLFPLLFKNGQTLSKKMFNLAVVSKQGYQIKVWQVFARFAFFAMEIVLSIYTIMGAFLISYTLMIFTKGNRSAHDYVAGTSVVNLKQSLIFANEQEAGAYESKLQAETELQEMKREQYRLTEERSHIGEEAKKDEES
jgi:uncharacterized RDD family membrane protein YckC